MDNPKGTQHTGWRQTYKKETTTHRTKTNIQKRNNNTQDEDKHTKKKQQHTGWRQTYKKETTTHTEQMLSNKDHLKMNIGACKL